MDLTRDSHSLNIFGYASQRWLRLLAVVLAADDDVRTQDAWSREAGVSPTVLRARCRGVGVTAKHSLDFVRVLRVSIRNQNAAFHAFEVLDVVDIRTMRRLLRTAGIDSLDSVQWPSIAEYLAGQSFIRDPLLVRAVADFCE